MSERAPRIVVAGGGFGGLYAASYLARSELAEQGATVTLVDRKNHFTFTPLLAEVAAGALGREHVTYSYRVLGRRYGFSFRRDAVRGLDPARSVVHTATGDLEYDYLVLALGAEPRYFGNAAVQRHSLPLTSVDDALAIRRRVLECLERAAVSDAAAARRLLTFVVAGGGPAGVEVASEIRHLVNDALRPYYPGVPPARVLLVDAGDRILRAWDGPLACAGQEQLIRRGIELWLNTKIQDAAPGLVVAERPEGRAHVEAETLIWTAGTGPVAAVAEMPLPTDRGAVRVTPSLQVEGHENVFAVGDVTVLHDERAGRPYPRVAPIAISQGVRAAANIENHVLGRPLEPYHAHHAGKIVSLGDGVALVDILGIHVTGVLAWWLYRSAYLMKLVGTKNKVRVVTTLLLNRLFEPDVAG